MNKKGTFVKKNRGFSIDRRKGAGSIWLAKSAKPLIGGGGRGRFSESRFRLVEPEEVET